MSVHAAVSKDIDALEEQHPGIKDTALAAMALALAVELDDPETSKSAGTRTLLDVLDRLHKSITSGPDGEEPKQNDLDRVRARRTTRHGGAGA